MAITRSPVSDKPVNLGLALLAGLVLLASLLALPASAQAGADPAAVGAFSAVFEEGGAEQPRCVRDEEDGLITCKPTAVSAVALADGRVLYWNGIEADENVTLTAVNELSPDSRNSQARILDLRGDAPQFEITEPGDAGASNPNITEGSDGTDHLPGVLGVPGRPGDGLVGSTVGQVVPMDPTSPPDDPQNNDGDMFCAYQHVMYDGRVVSYGGTDWYNEPSTDGSTEEGPTAVGGVELEGLRNTRVFDPETGSWSQAGHMRYGRWYPAGVTLPDGRITTFSGVTKLIKNTQLSNVRRSETFDPATEEWTENFTGMASENSLPLFPRLHLTPNGKIFFAGNGQQWTPAGQAADEATWAIQQFWNPDTLEWEIVGLATLGWRSSALDVMLPLDPPYDSARILMAGGVLGPSPGTYIGTTLSEEYTVGADDSVSQEFTGELNNPRWFSQAVLLPDGQVLAVNGGNRDEVIAPGTEESIFETELYDPESRTWTPAAVADRGRTYHNSAILMADGRVLVGGHSPISLNYTHRRDLMNNNDKDSSFQVYSPPYLFRGERPEILSAPADLGYGQTVSVPVSSPSEIESVILMRLQATTHEVDNDQRGVRLEFRQTGTNLHVTAPPDGVVAPPGHYWLFVNRSTPEGPVPSVAASVTVGVGTVGRAPIMAFDTSAAADNGSATPLEDTTLRTPGDCPGCAEGEQESTLLTGVASQDPTMDQGTVGADGVTSTGAAEPATARAAQAVQGTTGAGGTGPPGTVADQQAVLPTTVMTSTGGMISDAAPAAATGATSRDGLWSLSLLAVLLLALWATPRVRRRPGST